MSTDQMQEIADQCLEMMRTMGAMMGMHGGAGDHAGGMDGVGSMVTAGGIALLVLLLLIVVGGALLAVVLTRRRSSDVAAGAGRALDELDRRYARGEVERDSYLQIREDLRDAHG